MNKETEVLAFPSPVDYYNRQNGMTLRDFFAAKAMQAFIVKGVTPAEGLNKKQAITSMAYETADAMMEARK
jgi:hypothetical protein